MEISSETTIPEISSETTIPEISSETTIPEISSETPGGSPPRTSIHVNK